MLLLITINILLLNQWSIIKWKEDIKYECRKLIGWRNYDLIKSEIESKKSIVYLGIGKPEHADVEGAFFAVDVSDVCYYYHVNIIKETKRLIEKDK